MLEPAVVVLRLMQYAGAMVLMGSSLFFIYALPSEGVGAAAEIPWARKLLAAGGALLAIAALLSVLGQASVLTGSLAEGVKLDSLTAVVTSMDLGKAAVTRAALAAVAAMLVLTLKPSRLNWILAAALGGLATASLAWMGHGAATEGPGRAVHLVADVLHGWAAAIWIGALVAFWLLLRTGSPTAEATRALHRALHGFAGVGTGLVAVLVATGLVNGWFLVGPDHLSGLWASPYGQLLCLKLLLFAAMLGLAAANRFRLTPRLALSLGSGDAEVTALAGLRRSLVIETATGMSVLALVAWFGTLAPPSSM